MAKTKLDKELKVKEANMAKARAKHKKEADEALKKEVTDNAEQAKLADEKINKEVKAKQDKRRKAILAQNELKGGKPAKKDSYNLVVTLNDKDHKIKTSDIAGALRELDPQVFKTKVVITASKKFGKKTATREFVFTIPHAKRIFRNELAGVLFEKNLRLAFDGR